LLKLCDLIVMRKMFIDIRFEVFCCCFAFFYCEICSAQKPNFVIGKVVDALGHQILQKIAIIGPGGRTVFTTGEFILEALPVTCQIEINKIGFRSKILQLDFSEQAQIDLGNISLVPLFDSQENANSIELSENQLSEDDIGGANVITGLLQSSKDVFLRSAAFNFGQARFKVRGYDSREGNVMLNGIVMNKHFDGRPQWSNWGGLNDVLRNQTFSAGIAASEHTFGGLLGSTNFSTRASEYRPGSSVSFAASNGSYRGRIMASHFTGTLENDWYFAFSGSNRSAQNGAVEGTTYKAYSFFMAAEKVIDKNHSLNFTSILAFNRRGKSSPNTQEVYDLKGNNYNAYWGVQMGDKRNSRIKEIHEPIFMLSHYWQPNKRTDIETTVSYQFGHIGNSRLGYSNAPNPDPTYYKKLPSHSLQYKDYRTAYLSLEDFQENGQLNWQQMYAINANTKTANYYVYEDRNDDTTWTIRTALNRQMNTKLQLAFTAGFTQFQSHNYAKVLDVLGANGFKDIDTYAQGEASQNDSNHPNRMVTEGDHFSYNYRLKTNQWQCYGQSRYQLKKMTWHSAIQITRTKYQREGLYRNGGYPKTSFGKGEEKRFFSLAIKTNLLYKFTGRHLLQGNLAYFTKQPSLRNVYANVRIHHEFTPELSNETIQSADVNYQYRAPGIKARLSVYYSFFANGIENAFAFAQGLRGDEADFVAMLTTDIEKKHRGLEFGLEYDLSATSKLYTVVALGHHSYANNPNVSIQSSSFINSESDFGKAYLKNYKLGGTPQNAYSIGLEYRDPAYWWVAINGNMVTHNYLSISPLLRTNNFFLDKDGVPFVHAETGSQITQEDVAPLWRQERFKDLFLINLIGGKSWKIQERYISLFASVNNVLGTIYKTGGFEQSRKANYKELQADKALKTPLFGPKYWLGNGTSYYVIVSMRF